MARVSPFPTGPQLGNRFTAVSALSATNEVASQVSLNATIQRVNEIRSSFDAFSEQGQRIGESIKGMGELLASKASEKAEQLRGTMDKSIEGVIDSTSKDLSQRTSIISARNQMSKTETGKGNNVDTQA